MKKVVWNQMDRCKITSNFILIKQGVRRGIFVEKDEWNQGDRNRVKY